MTKETLKIEGMSCENCVHHVTEVLKSVAGVKSAKVSLKKNEAVVKYDDETSVDAMRAAVAQAGYKVI
ncbi:copper chaperone [Lactococcus hircilactis]|uniref:Copper chaperone n=1 Tax=Lactococcus hircilactis TaxID=1494462 RepID=A0A7X2D1U0_9LACT|nr:cation transporter [Lactococcus hircilactis]MQW39415.1 copper chaperone [Lactococcus hircilactis]